MRARGLNVVHAIHDFLPRHHAGSEIYAHDLCRALGARHHVSILSAEFDPLRQHGQVTWRVYDELPVVELVNNWRCPSFAETYRPPLIGERISQVLDALQPDVVHVHNLLNLSFELPSIVKRRGVPVVATLHDYTLVCPSGGQRLHQADAHVCHTIDVDRCARCFRESPLFTQMAVSRAAGPALARGRFYRAAGSLVRRLPRLAALVSATSRHVGGVPVTPEDISTRLAAARQVFGDIDLFVTPSRSMAAEFEKLGLRPAQIRVAEHGFAPLAGSVSPRSARQPGEPLRIGFVGTLVWHKGVHQLIEAARQLPPHGYDVRVFGDPAVSPAYVSSLRVSAANLPIRFMGPFDRRETRTIYSQLDVLVVPSLWLENSPLVIREAFLAGVPVIGARIGGIPELITHDVNGLLYEPSSTADLAAALGRLIENPAQLTAFRAALPSVRTIEDDARGWEAIYADVIAASRQ